MDKLDAQTLASLLKEGIDPSVLRERSVMGLPANTAGIADLVAYTDPGLKGTNTLGYVVSSPGRPSLDRIKRRAALFLQRLKQIPTLLRTKLNMRWPRNNLGIRR